MSSDPSNVSPPSSLPILGSAVSQIDMATALEKIGEFVGSGKSHYVCVPDVYQVVYAYDHPSHREIINQASMVTPDGTPLVWVSRLRGSRSISRVAGPDLLPSVCEYSVDKGWRHYFYGGAEGVAEDLAKRLSARYPGLQISGFECPPFRPLNDDEDAEVVDRINRTNPDIVWVGLGCPKQEVWASEHVGKISGAVIIPVGAAFDFHTDRVRRAPAWMRNNGLEWLYRLYSEPRRLWKRYVIAAPRFIYLAVTESIKNRRGVDAITNER